MVNYSGRNYLSCHYNLCPLLDDGIIFTASARSGTVAIIVASFASSPSGLLIECTVHTNGRPFHFEVFDICIRRTKSIVMPTK